MSLPTIAVDVSPTLGRPLPEVVIRSRAGVRQLQRFGWSYAIGMPIVNGKRLIVRIVSPIIMSAYPSPFISPATLSAP